jgi:ATP-dependent Clp protease ATP-binding subunit ClpA
LETVRAEAKQSADASPKRENVVGTPYTPRVKKVLGLAAREAKALHHTYIGTEHILLGLLREGDGAAARILEKLGMNLEETRRAILAELDPNCKSAAGAPSTASPMSPKSAPPTHVVFSDKPGEPVDTSQRYDIYCTDWSQGVTVYRNARFKGIKQLMQRTQHDVLSSYVELEQADGRTVFVARSSIIRFTEPEEKPTPEGGTGGKE